ncbi:protein Niban 3 [Ambystoma mexicanum]|uniref:protein Niban 3 n=1 Tax=Ambystoma mexicanum TaxID=8296 RepID=UPI0037E7452D
MGGGYSKQPDVAQRRYLRGRTEAVVKTFFPYYQRQVAAATLRRLWREAETPGGPSRQLLQCQIWKSPGERLHQGSLLYFRENSRKWQEGKVAVRGDYTLEWFEDKLVQPKGDQPRECASLSGYQLVTTFSEYTELVDNFCRVLTVGSSDKGLNPLTSLPTAFPLFLYHPFRKHLCFCCSTAESQHTWKCTLLDGIRHHNTVLQRGDSFHVEAFLESVRFFRQEKGRYGSWQRLVGSEPEILSNLVMEDLLPVLESSVASTLKGPVTRQKNSWFQFLQAVYSLILAQVSAELDAFQAENDDMHKALERAIRPDLDQLLALKEQISGKLQGTVGPAARACYIEKIHPDLDHVMEELMEPISSGLEATRSTFSDRISELIANAENCSAITLQKEVFTLGDLPWDSVLMQRCYEKTAAFQECLQGLGERFDLHSLSWLQLQAQNLMQQFMQNMVYTFQQLLNPHLTSSADPVRLIQTLGKVKVRVLKKFDSDSSRARRRFARDSLAQIFLPFLLRHLEADCKRELPKYDSYVFADYNAILHVENIYEDIIRGVLQDAVDEALKDASRQRKHHLGSESYASILESRENLLGLDKASADGRAGLETPERAPAPGSPIFAADDVENLPRHCAESTDTNPWGDTTGRGISEQQNRPHIETCNGGPVGSGIPHGLGEAIPYGVDHIVQCSSNGAHQRVLSVGKAPVGQSETPSIQTRGFLHANGNVFLGSLNGTRNGALFYEGTQVSLSDTAPTTQNGGLLYFTSKTVQDLDHAIYGNRMAYQPQGQAGSKGRVPDSTERGLARRPNHEPGLSGLAPVTESSLLLDGLSMELERTISEINKDLLEIDQKDMEEKGNGSQASQSSA